MRRRTTFISLLTPLLLLMLAACASDQSDNEVRALTNSFFAALKSGDTAKATLLVDGAGGTMQPLLRAAEEQKNLIPSYTIERVHKVDSDAEQVFVSIPGNDTTTTIALVARRAGESWKFDNTIQVETRLNSIITADGSVSPDQSSK
jgi:hypothetical protein